MAADLYLSPHLDDAVYSCGGLIARQVASGEPVTVLTVCAGDPPAGRLTTLALELHDRWGVGSSPVPARRAEDRVACGRLGALVIHLDLPDALYRLGPDGQPLYPSEAALFGPLNPAEADRIAWLAGAIKPACPKGARIYCPLGVGGHVDHRLTRLAAEALGLPLWYYPDLPYAARGGEVPTDLGLPDGAETAFPLAPEEIEAWAAAAAEYRSQRSIFWESQAALFQELRAHHDEGGGLKVIAPRE